MAKEIAYVFLFKRRTHLLQGKVLTRIMCNYFESCKRLNTFTWNMKEAYLFIVSVANLQEKETCKSIFRVNSCCTF